MKQDHLNSGKLKHLLLTLAFDAYVKAGAFSTQLHFRQHAHALRKFCSCAVNTCPKLLMMIHRLSHPQPCAQILTMKLLAGTLILSVGALHCLCMSVHSIN